MSASAASASASAPRAHASRRTSSRSHRVAASTPSSAASRRRRERAASASSTSSDSTPSAPSALATGAAWDDAWGSIADDPDTRVAYVDDADRDSLRATLAASSLREALAGADVGETIVSGVLSTSAPIDVRGVLNLPRELLRDSDHYSAALPGLEAIERDVAAIVERYGVIARARSARVHVSLLRRTLCSKFHVDHVPLRVMVTYFGAGTEVLTPRVSALVARLNATRAPAVSDVAKWAATRFGPPPRAAREAEIVLMKGEKWPGCRGKAIVHRSPDVDGCCGEWRLTLRVDAEDEDDDADGNEE